MDSPNRFSSAEIESLGALCTTFFPSLPLAASGLGDDQSSMEVYEFYRASAPNCCSPSKVGGTMEEILQPAELHIMKKILWMLSTPVGTFLLAGRMALATKFPFVKRFGDLSLQTREQILLGWSTSSLSVFRAVFKAFKNSVAWNHFTTVNENGRNPFWKAIGYCGPDPVAMSATLTPKPLENSIIDVSVLSGEDLNMALKIHGLRLADASSIANPETVNARDHVLECDVVIVGSGSGGVAAAVLAKAGFKVIVLEKGGYIARQDLSLLEREAIRDLYEAGKILTTDDQRMLVFAGSTVGGGSAVNWSASLRTPDHVLREWNEDLNLPLFGSQRYRDAMDEVCKRLGVQGEIDNENFQNTVLRTGCEKLGYHVANIPINATPDHYCGWCTFGCRKGMKQGTSETWLVDAAQAGAVILTRCHAQRVLHNTSARGKSRKAIGVVAKTIVDNEDRHLFIKARATVVACGALQTPPLLRRSGLKNPHIGRNLHLHPAQILWGYFPQGTAPEGSCYEGAPMTAFSNEAANWKSSGYGTLIQTPILHPGTFAAAMPWKSGSSFKESMVKYSRTCSLIVILRDSGSGTVGTKSDGSLNIHYKLRSDDAARARAGVEKALRVLVAAGAVEVGGHHQQLESFKVNENNYSDFEDYVKRVVGDGGAPLYAAHQMGSCKMGVMEGEGAVDEKCESWEMEGLYLGDGSVLPTACGVNPMVTIQSIAFCTARNVVDYLNNRRKPA